MEKLASILFVICCAFIPSAVYSATQINLETAPLVYNRAAITPYSAEDIALELYYISNPQFWLGGEPVFYDGYPVRDDWIEEISPRIRMEISAKVEGGEQILVPLNVPVKLQSSDDGISTGLEAGSIVWQSPAYRYSISLTSMRSYAVQLSDSSVSNLKIDPSVIREVGKKPRYYILGRVVDTRFSEISPYSLPLAQSVMNRESPKMSPDGLCPNRIVIIRPDVLVADFGSKVLVHNVGGVDSNVKAYDFDELAHNISEPINRKTLTNSPGLLERKQLGELLLDAAKSKDWMTVEQAIMEGAYLGVRNETDHFTLLTYIVIDDKLSDKDSARLLELALSYGAPIDKYSVPFAASQNKPRSLEMLLRTGASPDEMRDRMGSTALAAAVRKNNPDCVALLLAAGADPDIKGRGFTAKSTPREVANEAGSLAALTVIEQFEDKAGKPKPKIAPRKGEQSTQFAADYPPLHTVSAPFQLMLGWATGGIRYEDSDATDGEHRRLAGGFTQIFTTPESVSNPSNINQNQPFESQTENPLPVSPGTYILTSSGWQSMSAADVGLPSMFSLALTVRGGSDNATGSSVQILVNPAEIQESDFRVFDFKSGKIPLEKTSFGEADIPKEMQKPISLSSTGSGVKVSTNLAPGRYIFSYQTTFYFLKVQ